MKGEIQPAFLPMLDFHTFAVKWLEIFRDPNTDSKELYGLEMAYDCRAVGFEMDSGKAFVKKYGIQGGDVQALGKIIDDIDDIMILGSGIFSFWRYFNHWADPDDDILDPENREWFILALSRLEVLSRDSQNVPVRSIGKIQRIKIHSDSSCMVRPQPDEEVEQRLTITRDGRVFFSSYVFGEGFGHFKRAESKNFRISGDKAERIMTALEDGFSTARFDVYVFDIGDWTAEIINDTDDKYKFECALIGGINTKDGVSVSDIVREELGMPRLYVFDGNCADSERPSK